MSSKPGSTATTTHSWNLLEYFTPIPHPFQLLLTQHLLRRIILYRPSALGAPNGEHGFERRVSEARFDVRREARKTVIVVAAW